MTAEPSPVTTRRPLPDDLGRITEIESLCFTDPWELSALAAEMAEDHLRMPLVAEVGGRVVGYLMAWKIVEILHVLNIAADPAGGRRGIGSTLLLAAADEGRDLGMERITLEVRRSNAGARAFYAKFGFVETGVREGYYAEDGEDAIILDVLLADMARP
jgi:ribosomal-protein-alanine N-acetyltransferase